MMATPLEAAEEHAELRAVCPLGSRHLRATLQGLRTCGVHRVLLESPFGSGSLPPGTAEAACVLALRMGLQPDIAVEPLTTGGYRRLRALGSIGVVCHQITYDPDVEPLPRHTPRLNTRLDAPIRALDGGLHRIGLTVVLNLSDPEREVASLATQARALYRRDPTIDLTLGLFVREATDDDEMEPIGTDTFVRYLRHLNRAAPFARLAVRFRPADAAGLGLAATPGRRSLQLPPGGLLDTVPIHDPEGPPAFAFDPAKTLELAEDAAHRLLSGAKIFGDLLLA